MFCAMAGMTDMVDHPDFRTGNGRNAHADALAELIRPWFRERSKQEIFDLCGEFHLPGAFVATAPDMLTLPPHESRKFMVNMDVPEHESIKMPGVPVRFAGMDHEQPGSAPRLGEHNAEVYGTIGYGPSDLDALARKGAI
jgi:crotonobetainyl-CoA:carnitine CoA-transferase CaiB-like acyl-CoA transferase